MIKRISLLAVIILMLTACVPAFGEAPSFDHIVDLISHPDASYSFDENAEILEVVFPQVHGADACILRCGGKTMLVDAGREDMGERVGEALALMGITEIDYGFCSHAHADHIMGFISLPESVSIRTMLMSCDENRNTYSKRITRELQKDGTTFEMIGNGDVLRLGQAELQVWQEYTAADSLAFNDESAMLFIRFGERTLFLTGDIEARAQLKLLRDHQETGIHADVMKCPHHGHQGMKDDFLTAASPELTIITAHEYPARTGIAQLKRFGLPYLSTWYGILRLRTDGHIWVLDAPAGGYAEDAMAS